MLFQLPNLSFVKLRFWNVNVLTKRIGSVNGKIIGLKNGTSYYEDDHENESLFAVAKH